MKLGVVNTRKRFPHNLSHSKLASFNMGELIPVGLVECLPGDTFDLSTSAFLRLSPMVRPMMHTARVKIDTFFVPKRLCWTNFLDWASGGEDGLNASVPPTISLTNPAVGSLADYLGIPTGTFTRAVSAMPFRAYNLIYNNWYRDEDLIPKLPVSTADGVDVTTNTTLQMRCWEKDEFTTCRPWEQKGPDITIPLATTAQVMPNSLLKPEFRGATSGLAGTLRGQPTNAVNTQWNVGGSAEDLQWRPGLSGGKAYTGLEVDLSTASAVSVLALREALSKQTMQENRAYFGSRPTEYLRMLGVTPQDQRLQIPEYLGSSTDTVQISEVLQTAPGADDTPVGDLYGHGATAARTRRYRYHVEEHGYIMVMMTVIPQTVYMDGLPKLWSRVVKEEEFQPELVAVGQVAVKNKEVYLAHATPDGEFGWQDRYYEYRSVPNTVHGEFRTIDMDWHMARSFSSAPALNAAFVRSDPTTRPFASTDTDQVQARIHHRCSARRLLPTRAVRPQTI